MRQSFKGEILKLQAELQLERQASNLKARKVAECELMELMLESLRVARRNGEASGHAVPIPDDVWYGLHQIARRLELSPGELFERLVVEKFAELGLATEER